MTDKVQKIREEVEKLKSQLLRGACSSQIAMETMCKEEAYDEVLTLLDTMQEEHCTETEFREIEILRTKLSDIAKTIYYHEGKENPTVERIREIVQDCCFELMDLEKPKQEKPISEKKCIFTKDNYTDENRRILCENCKEKCVYSKKEEPASEVWHDVSEEPKSDKDIAVVTREGCMWSRYKLEDLARGWKQFVNDAEIDKWAYVSDLINL